LAHASKMKKVVDKTKTEVQAIVCESEYNRCVLRQPIGSQ
jgi:hypothetical protein